MIPAWFSHHGWKGDCTCSRLTLPSTLQVDVSALDAIGLAPAKIISNADLSAQTMILLWNLSQQYLCTFCVLLLLCFLGCVFVHAITPKQTIPHASQATCHVSGAFFLTRNDWRHAIIHYSYLLHRPMRSVGINH